MTSKVSSNAFTNSESSIRVISLNASSSSSVLIFAMAASFQCLRPRAGWALALGGYFFGCFFSYFSCGCFFGNLDNLFDDLSCRCFFGNDFLGGCGCRCSSAGLSHYENG